MAALLPHRLLRDRDIAFDQEFDLDTDRRLEVPEFSIEKRHQSERYLPTYVDLILALGPALPPDPQNYIFVDIGAGKGRVVLLASHYPFQKVIGVEFVPELCTVMNENLRKYRSGEQRCHNLEAVCADAIEYALPNSQCVLFLFNPMQRDALEKFIDRVRASYLRHPRKIILLFLNPNPRNKARAFLEDTGIFQIRDYDNEDFKKTSPWALLACETDPPPT